MPNQYFQFKQFTIEQSDCAMKVGTDGVLLGAWAPVVQAQRILDIGTGSGCIAISLAKMMPQATVTAWDISPEAIETAESNNKLNGTNVTFARQDIFAAEGEGAKYDIIVSNPPYIKENEKIKQIPDKCIDALDMWVNRLTEKEKEDL